MLNMPTLEQASKAAAAHQGQQNLFAAAAANASRARRASAWLSERIERAKAEGGFTEIGVDLDPVLAEILLGNNPDNRSLGPVKVDQYVTDVRNGAWLHNGESIKVALNGEMNDGQHRCHAVILAGRPIKTDIRFGVSRESRMTLDQGRARTVGDYLSMESVEYAKVSASVASFLFSYERTGEVSTRSGSGAPTKAQVMETFHANPKITDSIKAVPVKGSNLSGGMSTLAFCHYIFAKKNPEAATSFIKSLVKGAELREDDAIYVCREELRKRERLTVNDKVELIFHAWNAHRKNRRVKLLRRLGKLPPVER